MNLLEELKQILDKASGIIPLPVLVLAVLIAFLVVAPLAMIDSILGANVKSLDDRLYVIEYGQGVLYSKLDKLSTSSVQLKPAPSVRRIVPPVQIDSSQSGEVK